MNLQEYCKKNKLFMPGDQIRAKTFGDIRANLSVAGYELDIEYDYTGNRVESCLATHSKFKDINITINDSRKLRDWSTISNTTGELSEMRFFTRIGSYKRTIRLPISCYDIQFHEKYTPEQRLKKYNICVTELTQELQNTTKPQEKTQQKESAMNLNFNAQDILDQNKEAAMTAAKIEVGEAAVAQLVKLVKPKLPMMARGYADLPMFDILVANLVVMAIRQYAPQNEKALVVADAMLLSAMQKQMKEFNIPGMIDEFVSKVDVSAITKGD
ncbi:hypothetical protein NVP2275O_255 [Vibrio phage 2.275.O._10N.286.54.E11]|nr:hypothetical protein NVP2275O_255 [Vibrio phage 2.275.O._10N.286.54.E11]